jgi:hypothetical protein
MFYLATLKLSGLSLVDLSKGIVKLMHLVISA